MGPCSPYAPVFESVCRSMARMVPSRIAPTRTCMRIACRGEEIVIDSSRVKTIIAGRPVFIVTIAG